MKKTLLKLLLFVGFLFVAHTASAKGVIVYSNELKIVTVEKLPEAFVISEDSVHVNLGVAFEQFSLFWIPVWNYGETRYVLVTDDEEQFLDGLTPEDLQIVKEDTGVDTSKEPAIPFWDKIGGKLIWGAVLLFIIFGMMSNKKDDDNELSNDSSNQVDYQSNNTGGGGTQDYNIQ